jgi:hypothetical protein
MTIALILAGAALLASDPVPSVSRTGEATVMKVADYAPTVKWKRRLHDHRHYSDIRFYPVACEAVRFPRSPLCADRPYRPSYYDSEYYHYRW